MAVNSAKVNLFTFISAIIAYIHAPIMGVSNPLFELCFLQRYTDPEEGEIAQQLSESNVGDQKVIKHTIQSSIIAMKPTTVVSQCPFSCPLSKRKYMKDTWLQLNVFNCL